jgi:anthranilate/para-aminobenzoate synthase component II
LNFSENAEIIFIVEQLGIVHGFVHQKQSDGKEYDAREPDAQERSHDVLFDKFFSEHIQEMEHQEEHYCHYQRHPESTFSDDGAQWGTDKEEHDAGKGK